MNSVQFYISFLDLHSDKCSYASRTIQYDYVFGHQHQGFGFEVFQRWAGASDNVIYSY